MRHGDELIKPEPAGSRRSSTRTWRRSSPAAAGTVIVGDNYSVASSWRGKMDKNPERIAAWDQSR